MTKPTLNIVPIEDVFADVRRALLAYDAHQSTHAEMVEQVIAASSRDAHLISDVWLKEEDRLKLEVGVEFVKVTPNNADAAKLVGIAWAKEMSGYSRLVDYPLTVQREDYIHQTLEVHKITGRPVTAEQAHVRFTRIHGMGGK